MKKTLSELKLNSSFCSMPWIHQFLDPTGRVKPCCRFDEGQRPDEINLKNDSLSNIFYGQWMSNIRSKMLNGETIAGCKRCYEEEASGKKSLRQRYNDSTSLVIEDLVDIEKPKIRWLELAISNACNLACRMCDSRYSLKWYDEELKHWGEAKSSQKISKTDISNIDPFIKDLVHLKFTGGEPLITPEHWTILDKLLELTSDPSKIFLNYSTNCTIYPKPQWVEKWKKLKRVEFALSFDSSDPGESEYIRWPSKFEVTEKTTRAYFELSKLDNFEVLLRSTVSILNVYHLPETILWWYENVGHTKTTINPTHLTYPQILSVTVLPPALKEKVTAKFQPYLKVWYPKAMRGSLQHILKYMNSKDNSHLLGNLCEYIEKTDQYRKQSFSSIYPQFSDIFDMARETNAIHPETEQTYPNKNPQI